MEGNRLNALRKRAKLSQQQIADELGVSTAQISRWENGENNIPSERLPLIARAYVCRIGEIFEDMDIPAPVQTPQPEPDFQFLHMPVMLPSAAKLTDMFEGVLETAAPQLVRTGLAKELALQLPAALQRLSGPPGAPFAPKKGRGEDPRPPSRPSRG